MSAAIVNQLLESLRGRVDPLVARRFACDCVRRIWDQVESQPFVSPQILDECRRAFEMTVRSTDFPIADSEIQTIDFSSITDSGNSAFMAASHVGWNLFAAINGLHPIDEFVNASQTAFLVASVVGLSETNRQVEALQQILDAVEGCCE